MGATAKCWPEGDVQETQRCRPSEPLGDRCAYRHNRRELYNRSATVLFSEHAVDAESILEFHRPARQKWFYYMLE